MTIEQAIEKAIEGGWKPKVHRHYSLSQEKDYRDMWEAYTLLDTSFWQSLGKAMGWGKTGLGQYKKFNSDYQWQHHWHSLIDFLSDGGSIEDYFKSL
ncbi:hypothetical protein LCGC14_0417890 [marine sediment metagenome]|uniref:Uncharacterized protein n=1 Tax=marine sediment metagenome TaxID=412755 RepID=A0A0F9W0V6_9ZZZZ